MWLQTSWAGDPWTEIGKTAMSWEASDRSTGGVFSGEDGEKWISFGKQWCVRSGSQKCGVAWGINRSKTSASNWSLSLGGSEVTRDKERTPFL